MYSYLNISMDKNIVPDEIKGRPIHISFPLNLFVVNAEPALKYSIFQKLLFVKWIRLLSIDAKARFWIIHLCPSILQPHTLHLNQNVLKLLKWWTWQFVIIRPVFSVFMITMQLFGIYSGIISTSVSVVLNISVSLALYALVLFYHAFVKELAPHNPLAKFLCVKGIVFFSFWQVNSRKTNSLKLNEN